MKMWKKMPSEVIRRSKNKALEMIKKYLEADNIEEQFQSLSGDYYDSQRFLVVWAGNYGGIPAQFSINKIDEDHRNITGAVANYSSHHQMVEKQIKAYSSFERALCDVGLKLCRDEKSKIAFFKKYVIPYNRKIKKKR